VGASALFCGATVWIVQDHPHTGWVQAYGPNVAAMFLGVAFTLGGVQFFLDREQKRLRAPAERAAVGAAREVLISLTDMVIISVLFLNQAEATKTTGFRDLTQKWGGWIQVGDLTVDGPNMFAQAPMPLNRWIGDQVRASVDAYRTFAPLITQYCPPPVAQAAQDLMQGRGNRLIHILGWGTLPRLGSEIGDRVEDFVDSLLDMEAALDESGIATDLSMPATYVRGRSF